MEVIRCQALFWMNLSRPCICLNWKRRLQHYSNKRWQKAAHSKRIQSQGCYLHNRSSRYAPHISRLSCIAALMTLLSPQASTQTLALINSLCVMLHTTPFHRENYSRLIISVMIQFYSRCSDHFRSLVSRGESSGAITEVYLSVPATWAQRPEIASCLGNLYFSVCFCPPPFSSISHFTLED